MGGAGGDGRGGEGGGGEGGGASRKLQKKGLAADNKSRHVPPGDCRLRGVTRHRCDCSAGKLYCWLTVVPGSQKTEMPDSQQHSPHQAHSILPARLPPPCLRQPAPSTPPQAHLAFRCLPAPFMPPSLPPTQAHPALQSAFSLPLAHLTPLPPPSTPPFRRTQRFEEPSPRSPCPLHHPTSPRRTQRFEEPSLAHLAPSIIPPPPPRRTQRFEAHIWEDRRQVYLGGYDVSGEGGGTGGRL